jgi:hypothetical protein
MRNEEGIVLWKIIAHLAKTLSSMMEMMTMCNVLPVEE